MGNYLLAFDKDTLLEIADALANLAVGKTTEELFVHLDGLTVNLFICLDTEVDKVEQMLTTSSTDPREGWEDTCDKVAEAYEDFSVRFLIEEEAEDLRKTFMGEE